MLKRGDVVEVKLPTIGFGRGARRELALVLQADPANERLATTILAPVDLEFDARNPHPFDVIIPGGDLGATRDHAVHLHHLQRFLRDQVGRRAGAADRKTLAEVTRRLRLLLG